MVLDSARVTKPWVVYLFVRDAALRGDLRHGLGGLGQYRFLAGEFRDAPQDHVAVRRTDLHAVADPVKQVRGDDGSATPEEGIFCGADGYVA